MVVETRQGISVDRVGQGADLLPILFGVVAHGVSGHAEGTQQDDIRLEELTAQGGRNGEHIAGDDGAAGHDGKVQTEANAEVNGVEQDRQCENELVAADRHARADVAQHADGVHDGHLEERAQLFALEGVVDDEPEDRRYENDHEEDDHFHQVEVELLLGGHDLEAFLQNGDYTYEQNEKFKSRVDIFTFGLTPLLALRQIRSPRYL